MELNHSITLQSRRCYEGVNMAKSLNLNAKTFRQTMGLFATGVTVLATRTANGEVVGMTANAVASVSLDPMLMLVCVGKEARIVPYLLASEGFSFNILSAAQQRLSDYFASLWPDDEPAPTYAFKDWDGGPLLAGCVGAVGCSHHEICEGGDHWIVLGRVTALYRGGDTADPLLFFGGQYRQLNLQEEQHE
jgi:flavin reductase (DIM6/NTAB) family NADH-FMN oxidoreductase RutF